MKIDKNTIFKISGNLVSKEIEGELVIVPLDSGIGDLNADLYSLNDTGRLVWKSIDGSSSVNSIITTISSRYTADILEIEKDIIDLLKILESKGFLTRV